MAGSDTTACIFWLKNRREKEWRDKVHQEHSGELGIKTVIVAQLVKDTSGKPLLAPKFDQLTDGEN